MREAIDPEAARVFLDLLCPPEAAPDAEAAERSLHEFVTQAWPVLEPENQFRNNWHIELVCEYLEAVSLGQIKRLIINEPPRHSKSTICTVLWPVHTWIARPALRWLFTSYSGALSLDHSYKRRILIESSWFQERWGNRFRMATDQNVKTHFKNDLQGEMMATSVGGSTTGFGGDVIVCDDVHNADDQDNEEAIKKTVESIRTTTIPSRLNDAKSGAIVIIGHRLHEEDTSSWYLKNEPEKWTHVSLTATAIGHERVFFPLSGRIVEREDGSPLQPERFDKAALADIKRGLGSRKYDGQYLQSPRPIGGGIVKEKWFRYYVLSEYAAMFAAAGKPRTILPDRFDEEMHSWDMAFKDYSDSSWVDGTHWAKLGANKYLRAEARGHWDFPSTCRELIAFSAKWPTAHRKLVEDKANGPAVIAQLRNIVPGLIPRNPRDSKVARLASASVDAEAGNVWLPDPEMPGYAWVRDWVDEICKCSNEKSGLWDRADTFSQSMIYWQENAGSSLASLGSGQFGEPITAGLMSANI
jgi:hypothetical protein